MILFFNITLTILWHRFHHVLESIVLVLTAEGISLLKLLSLHDFDIWHVPSLNISCAYLRRCTKVTKETRKKTLQDNIHLASNFNPWGWLFNLRKYLSVRWFSKYSIHMHRENIALRTEVQNKKRQMASEDLKIEMIGVHYMLDTDYDMTYISSGNKWQLFDSIVDLKCLSMVWSSSIR